MNKVNLPSRVGVLTQSPTGSNYTCNPPVTDTDVDFLVLVEDLGTATARLGHDGWHMCAGKEGHYENDKDYSLTWYAVRKGKVNLILTEDPSWYNRAVHATTVCKQHNVLEKSDRIVIFRWLRDGGGNLAPPEVTKEDYEAALRRWPL